MVAAPLSPQQISAATATVAAWEALASSPLPSRRQEDWRFTDASRLAAIEPHCWTGPDPFAGLVLPPGVSRLPADEAAALWQPLLLETGCDQHWPVRLNAGAEPARLALRIQADASPLASAALTAELDAAASRQLLAAQILLVLDPGASFELGLRLGAAARSACSVVVGAVLAEQASLTLALVASGHGDAALLAHLPVLQAPGSRLALSTVSSGWSFSRIEPRVLQQQGAAHTRLRGLQWVGEDQLADTHSLVRFDGPDGVLDQLHKSVADGNGRSVFNGAVQVPRAAQRTDAAQLSRSLLLGDRARIDTKPELEIVADDVRCAHGATVSQLQSEELFYLQSRGIARAQASRLLLAGYCQEVLRELPAAAAAWKPVERELQGA
ncbi:MAG: ABC transporter permease [Cyanobacteria bacterium K_Offshore_0m_m2_072]|nr:ABC transporter permease [Cyanobacteria bacterium K_Offshore_0m_m2_072]